MHPSPLETYISKHPTYWSVVLLVTFACWLMPMRVASSADLLCAGLLSLALAGATFPLVGLPWRLIACVLERT